MVEPSSDSSQVFKKKNDNCVLDLVGPKNKDSVYKNYIIDGNGIKCEEIYHLKLFWVFSTIIFDKLFYLNFFNNYFENLLFLENYFF